MGVKDVWAILGPYGVRKPISELSGKTVAIDLAGWVCESMSVVTNAKQTHLHLKNLFFRTCYLIWADITPLFVLEGDAPALKSQTMAKRNKCHNRLEKLKVGMDFGYTVTAYKERKRFDAVLKQCAILLDCLGIKCTKAPGEAEAFCAIMNRMGKVDGVISQDSDCFAYGAKVVYRNFSVSAHGKSGGYVDVYDINVISQQLNDFGQNKCIAMALLCGCDYLPFGLPGVGREHVLRFFSLHSDHDVLAMVRSMRFDKHKYEKMRKLVDDSVNCINCGHVGCSQSHRRDGCTICRTRYGCNANIIWKEKRLNLKSELFIRDKAHATGVFICEEMVEEFLRVPDTYMPIDLMWHKPNLSRFLCNVAPVLGWTELYSFQKMFPILTRWMLQYVDDQSMPFKPVQVIKKRLVRGIESVEVQWQDCEDFCTRFIPAAQREEYAQTNRKNVDSLLRTVEVLRLFHPAYPLLIEQFIASVGTRQKPTTVLPASIKEPLSIGPGVRVLTPLKNIVNSIAMINNNNRRTAANEDAAAVTTSVPSDLDSDDDDPFVLNTSTFLVEFYNKRGDATSSLHGDPGVRVRYEDHARQASADGWSIALLDIDEMKHVIRNFDRSLDYSSDSDDEDGNAAAYQARPTFHYDMPSTIELICKACDPPTEESFVLPTLYNPELRGAEGGAAVNANVEPDISTTESMNRQCLTRLIGQMEDAFYQQAYDDEDEGPANTAYDEMMNGAVGGPSVGNVSVFIADVDEENPTGDIFEKITLECTQCQ